MKDKSIYSRLLDGNEEEMRKLYEEYLSGKVKFNEDAKMGLLNQVFDLHNGKYKLNNEIIAAAGKSFAKQFENNGEVRVNSYLMFTMMVFFRDIVNEVVYNKKDKIYKGRNKVVDDSRLLLKRFINETKNMMIEKGTDCILDYCFAHKLEVNENIKGKIKIKMELTTSELFNLYKVIWDKRISSGPFPYKSVQSLGQVIRYHKDSMNREGYQIFTYRNKATFVALEYVLTIDETNTFKLQDSTKEWF